MLACLAAGRAFVPLDTDYPTAWLGQVLREARPTLIIADERGRCALEADHATIPTIPAKRVRQRVRPEWRPADLAQDEPACVLFTSGSTGEPKGIVNSQRNLLQRVAQSINSSHINGDDRLLTLASHCTIVGVRDVLTALIAGASIHIVDPRLDGAREMLHFVASQRVTILFAFPALMRSILVGADTRASPVLRLVRMGGDTTFWSDIDRLRAWLSPGAKIQLIYAATEAPIMQWFVDESCRLEDTRVPIGYPIPGNRLSVIDEHGCPTPPGMHGELVVTSPYVALGTWRAGAIVSLASGTFDVCPDRQFRTGDLVRQRPDGLLEHVGRKDRQVKIRGTRVELEGVEAALRRHPGVREVGALVRPSAGEDEPLLVAYISSWERHAALLGELRSLMLCAPAAMRPARLYRVSELPRLPSSKLDTFALNVMDQANAKAECAAPGSLPGAARANDCIAPTVAQVWHQVLGHPLRDSEEDFFDGGGDSLAAITFTAELERLLGVELPLTLINEAPRFGGFCEALRSQSVVRYVPLVLLKAGDDLPPLYLVHGAGGNVAELFQLARCMTYPGPVFGIQARGLARHELPQTSVEGMAADYVNAIRQRQPAGPYFLCGYSFGGLVAFEIAVRLRKAGEEVGLLGLFDATPGRLSRPLRPSWRSTGVRLYECVRWIRITTIAEWPASTRKALTGVMATLRGGRPATHGPDARALPAFLKAAPTSVVKVAASALMASARYRPPNYPGELKLFVPTQHHCDRSSAEAAWRRHARTVSVIDTPGCHLTMLSGSNAQTLAAVLSRCLPHS